MGLDLFELDLEVEEVFDVELNEAELSHVITVGELWQLTLAALKAQHPERFASDSDFASQAWQELVRLISIQLGLERERVVESARFVNDLDCL